MDVDLDLDVDGDVDVDVDVDLDLDVLEIAAYAKGYLDTWPPHEGDGRAEDGTDGWLSRQW